MTDERKPYQPYDRFHVANKDPNYVYRWANSRDRVMMEKLHVGWEVDRTQPAEIPIEVAKAIGQETANPGGGTTVTRGDVILMRIQKDTYEERVEKPRRAMAERQGTSLDTMVQQANENTKKALRDRGYKPSSIRTSHVFLDSDDGNINEQRGR